VLTRLASAHGYTVFDRRGKRVGTFIERAGESGEGIAIRHDGVFLWRRRVLPIATVTAVLPEHGAVVLGVDRGILEGTNATPARVGTTSSADEDGHDEDWHVRIARYVSAAESDSNAGKAGEDRERPLAAEDTERLRIMGASGQREGGSSGSAESAAQGHLLFVSTSHGYELVERHGPAPAVSDDVPVLEHDGRFRVAKLATSPLPGDRRVCAYLELAE
jgi:hypothetical protein